MYPQCDNATEAEQLVRWVKFPPMGRRGFDGANADVLIYHNRFRNTLPKPINEMS
ncbi:MAG: hypothetical protein R3C28_05530 [Pirellulaceae bacterium]